MYLSMVVIASLIGAQGLGSVVLQSLQYAAKGQGLLAGLAILLCAMVIDRIIQGSFRSRKLRPLADLQRRLTRHLSDWSSRQEHKNKIR